MPAGRRGESGGPMAVSPALLAAALAAPLALAYVLLAPPSADLAAASYRSYLVNHFGLTIWDNGWYGGHHLPAYSVLSPALGALLGAQAEQALAALAAAVLFALLLAGRFPRASARIAACWFALGVSIELLSGRVPFDLGLALGLLALWAALRERRGLACLAALLTSLASPVAGVFLLLACLAWALGAPGKQRERLHLRRAYASTASRYLESQPRGAVGVGRRFRLLLGTIALLVIVALAVAFPEGGSEPFVASSFWPAAALIALIALALPSRQAVLRCGALLYLAGLALAFLIANPLGGNAVRLGALAAGPLAAAALGERRRVLLALAPALLYWQLVAPIRDLASASGDPAVHAGYYAPLLGELRSLGALAQPTRIEVVATRDHWEARWIAPRLALARGWERQLDRAHDGLFYGSRPLTAERYRAWLDEQAVSYVALPDAPLDHSARAEARLLQSGAAGYLREVWRSAHWRLYAVTGARPLADGPGRLTALGPDSFSLAVSHPGRFIVRVRFSSYWALQSGQGCVQRTGGGWTEISAASSGAIEVGIAFSPARIFDAARRCRGRRS